MQSEIDTDQLLDRRFLKGVFHQAVYQCRTDGCAFYLCDPPSGRARLIATHHLEQVPWDNTFPEKVRSSRGNYGETCGDKSVALAVPLKWDETVMGVLVVVDFDHHRRFRERDVMLLQSLAEMTASVIRQNRRLARMTTQFRALHTIDVALSSSLELEEVLNLILEKAVALVGAEHGSLRKLDKKTGKLLLQAHFGTGWTREKQEYTLEMGQGIVRWVAENRRPYLCPDVREDPRYVILFEEMRSAVAVPLQYGLEAFFKPDAFLGVIFLESSEIAAFDKQDVELLEALAQTAVIAIQNATRHKKLIIEQERRLAAEKWAVMGQAATALAHRINNLMGVVPVSAVEIGRSLKKVEVGSAERHWMQENLNRIKRNSRFVLKLSDALFKPFKDAGPSAPLDVNRLLNEALESAEISDNIEITKDYDPQLPKVTCGLLLLDVFLELITNAGKAVAGRTTGRLRLETRTERVSEGTWVNVTISDNGKGIQPKQMAHLWSMFHQTKEGLGFGLWWLRTFVERQGGTISCRSLAGQGATFLVRLPAGELEMDLPATLTA